MIHSFGDKQTEKLWNGERTRFPREIVQRAIDKLNLLSAAASLGDLRIPPSNHLEVLKGARSGQYSIRVNRQWRLCFRWENGNAYEVVLTDYH